MPRRTQYPDAEDPKKVGKYTALAKAGGGFVWDAVLEYRVWVHGDPEGDFYCAFGTYSEAARFSSKTKGAESPLALIRQDEYIDEPEPEKYMHVKNVRIAEWPVEFLARPKRTERTIPDFLSPSAPANKLDILRGLAKKK